MDDKFVFGLCLGMVGGALLVTNSVKARQIVKDGQKQIESKVKELSESQKKSK